MITHCMLCVGRNVHTVIFSSMFHDFWDPWGRIEFCWEYLKERNHVEDLSVDGKALLKHI